jgi:2-desacetyl-2-hydroxyethyl bacteriochlorophyllide A dehydrogenase
MKAKMRAAVFEKEGVLTIKEIDVPKIQKGSDILVKIELCSICGTDVHIMSVPPGYIAKPGTVLGHELVGKVVEVGADVKTIKVGDRVVCNPNDFCEVCTYCKANLPNFCENIIAMGIEADGGFAEYVKISERVAHKISDNLAPEIAAFAEPLACLINGKNKIPVSPGDSALVCGAGAIGLLFLQIVKAAGAYPVIVSEPFESRREVARQCGADILVDPFKEDLAEIVKKTTKIGVDYAIDVVGSQLSTCLTNVRKGGTVLLFGLNSNAETKLHQYDITTREVKVLGTWLANASFPTAVKILESGKLNLKPLVTHVLPLSDTLKGIELLRKGEGIEIFIDPNL